ncbi:MAG: hypothetical protein GPJ51_10985 [Candidatus Heimdallarchaeota archaeon]|nr:hypothetical protein [Candidatus Heimdallarchaeota archaeon]
MFTIKSAQENRKPIFLVTMIFCIFILSSSVNLNEVVGELSITDLRIPLVFKTHSGGVRPDIGYYIAEQLSEINIGLEVIIEEWIVFENTILVTNDFDLAYVTISGGGASPDMRDVYTKDGRLNIFGLNKNIPYGNMSEEMQNYGVTIVDPNARQQLYYDWEQMFMDKIVPMLPFFSQRNYVGLWANTQGYDARWGLSDSLPYMSYIGLHQGQQSLDELNIASHKWLELNPLYSNELVWDLSSEPIVQYSPDYAPLKSGLVYDWEQIDESHYQFWMHDDLYWNPSYDTRDRTASSGPLSSVSTGNLLTGLKYGEYSNGINQQVTAKDAVFTYLAWANGYVSVDTGYHSWISNIYVDPVNDLSFHIHIDGNPNTPEIESYADFWTKLPWDILPEFYLNSTSSTVSYTSGGVRCKGLYSGIYLTPEWSAYSESAFGCGKYMLDYSTSEVTVLRRSPYWFGKGAIDGMTGEVPFVDTINIAHIPTGERIGEFKLGSLDIVDLTAEPTTRKQLQADPKFSVQSFLADSMSFLAFNLNRPFIGGVNNFQYLNEPGKEEYTKGIGIRKAICYAIDRDEINAVLFDGENMISHCPIYPSSAYYYYHDIIKYNHDLDASREWLHACNIQIPKLKLTVENHDKVGEKIIFQADYDTGVTVTSSELYYSVNGFVKPKITMLEEKDNYFTSNIGSSYQEETLVEFYIQATNGLGDKFVTALITFSVGTKNKALASFPLVSLVVLLVIPVIFRVRKKKMN